MAKILIVDDDPDIIEAATLFLKRDGFDVISASSRETGMDAIRSETPDLLILDIMMERSDDGLAMAQDLRRDGCAVPILMLTSINKIADMEYGVDDDLVPVDAFREKPIEPGTLIKTVRSLLASRKVAEVSEAGRPGE